MIDVSKLEKTQLQEVLRELQMLRSLQKALGKRGRNEYMRKKDKIDMLKVEYFDTSETSFWFIQQTSIELFKKLFWSNVTVSQIEFVKNQNLKWWMRIYCNDSMYDMSYNRFEQILK